MSLQDFGRLRRLAVADEEERQVDDGVAEELRLVLSPTIAQTTSTAAPVPLPAPPPPAPAPPTSTDPRERLVAEGAAALADHELLAILLGTHRPGGPRAALDTAAALLETAGTLPALALRGSTRLEYEGTPASAVPPLAATAELAHRIVRTRLADRTVLDHLDELARYLTLRYSRLDQEVSGAVYLDAHGGWMADEEIFLGTVARCAVEPRPILVNALDPRRLRDPSLPHPPLRRPDPVR